MLTVHINKPLFTDIIFFIHILIGNIDIIHILSTDLCIENLLIGFSFYIIVGITNINKEDIQITIFIAYVIIMNFYFYKIILVNKISMPEPELFLSGFGVRKGMNMNGYSLDNIVISHNAIKRYNEYEYPIKLDFNWVGTGTPKNKNMQQLYNNFVSSVSNVRVIRTPSNRPYECTFFWPLHSEGTEQHSDNYKEVDFIFTGYAKRISESEVSSVQNGQWY
jgi:hypothetical protein